jgi:hypothetical protein
MTSRLVMAALSALLLTGIAGCSDFRKAIGKEKSTPDEFQVVVRPPLSLPPGFADRPETIVEKANNRSTDSRTGASALLSVGDASGKSFDSLFDFSKVPADIRAKVDEETYGVRMEKRLPLQTLFGGMPDVGPVLDKMAEDARIRRAIKAGKAPTSDGTKAIDPTSDSTLTIK